MDRFHLIQSPSFLFLMIPMGGGMHLSLIGRGLDSFTIRMGYQHRNKAQDSDVEEGGVAHA